MGKITINKDKCKGCLLCISVCPKGLIVVDKNFNALGVRPVKFQESTECLGCSLCAIICPDCCIEVFK
ncbi:MAG: 4Fe-4S dicluster domain-containing protein [Candidatus Omnitrophica bacterium]|nr:4Fe-4S dicluster domain-containing protein [Candidatus Omnitrophota bacterium]MDD5592453.1 4Fe-4S dicluster domain-containing protein [Candidatus Omnitrophota bacterium]